MPREIITIQVRRHAACITVHAGHQEVKALSTLPDVWCTPPLQVGQCGNQVGCRFWELALREHAAYNAGGRYDEALSSFFENVDARTLPPTPLALNSHIRTLKVRASAMKLLSHV